MKKGKDRAVSNGASNLEYVNSRVSGLRTAPAGAKQVPPADPLPAGIILETRKLCKTFTNGGMQQHVIKNMDLQIREGDFTIIMGRSGSGKSTLLYALSGMDRPTIGDIFFGEENLSHMSNDSLALMRRENCGFVFQSMYLLDHMNVLDNVLTSGLLPKNKEPRVPRTGFRAYKKQTAERAAALLGSLGLSEQDWKKYPDQLSGGEKQRAAIARALINSPKILFADEPTGALNSSASEQVLDAFTQLNGKGQSIITVTHDLKTALRGNRILYMKDGSICGELELDPYRRAGDPARQSRLQQFLGEMGW
ncbi:ABC transporter ATP-binding protein [Eisenbergiella sp.]|uniref:ABC transporter ATP-binding protein n=1 Tax=Eisenbergiella sp. TaxID=1924109 RepID=UPI002F41DDC7